MPTVDRQIKLMNKQMYILLMLTEHKQASYDLLKRHNPYPAKSSIRFALNQLIENGYIKVCRKTYSNFIESTVQWYELTDDEMAYNKIVDLAHQIDKKSTT